MAKVFRDYAEVSESMLEGFTVVEVLIGINAEGSGIMIGLERMVDNVTIGIDVIYDPDCEDWETPFMVSEEYVKNINKIPKEPKNGIKIIDALENNNGNWPTIRFGNGKEQP